METTRNRKKKENQQLHDIGWYWTYWMVLDGTELFWIILNGFNFPFSSINNIDKLTNGIGQFVDGIIRLINGWVSQPLISRMTMN